MTKPARIVTLRGLNPSDEEVTDRDIVEVDGEPPPVSRVSVTCLAATTTSYAIVFPKGSSGRRRDTLRRAG
jgi:hypothetical protein